MVPNLVHPNHARIFLDCLFYGQIDDLLFFALYSWCIKNLFDSWTGNNEICLLIRSVLHISIKIYRGLLKCPTQRLHFGNLSLLVRDPQNTINTVHCSCRRWFMAFVGDIGREDHWFKFRGGLTLDQSFDCCDYYKSFGTNWIVRLFCFCSLWDYGFLINPYNYIKRPIVYKCRISNWSQISPLQVTMRWPVLVYKEHAVYIQLY